MPAALESASRPKLSVNKQSQPPVKAIPAQWESNPQNGLERYLARATSIPWWRQEVSAARGTQPALPPHPCPAQLSNPWGGALGSDRLHSMSCVPEQGPTSLLSPLVTGAVGVGREPHTEHVTKGTFAVMGWQQRQASQAAEPWELHSTLTAPGHLRRRGHWSRPLTTGCQHHPWTILSVFPQVKESCLSNNWGFRKGEAKYKDGKSVQPVILRVLC